MWCKQTNPISTAQSAFFAQLPSELTAPEVSVVDALDLVESGVMALLPEGVSLQQWAERRLPEHVADEVNASGIVFVPTEKESNNYRLNPCARLRSFFAPLPWKSLSGPEEDLLDALRGLADSWEALGVPAGIDIQQWVKGRIPELFPEYSLARAKKRSKHNPAPWTLPSRRLPVAAVDVVAEFLQSLPENERLPEEDALRSAVLTACILSGRPRPDGLSKMARVENSPRVIEAASALLPEGASLGAWIRARLGGEVALKEKNGDLFLEVLLDIPRWMEGVRMERELALLSLPDTLTPGEVALRDAVMGFFSRWEGAEPPENSSVLEDADVAAARLGLPAELARVTFCRWLSKRMPEVEQCDDMYKRVRIFLAGEYDMDNVARMGEPGTNKRNIRRAKKKQLKRKAEDM